MSIAVKSGLPSLGSTEGAVISADEVSVSEDGSAAASVGEDLPRGKSAYEIAKENGFDGTEAEWLASLKGATGAAGTNGKDGENGKTPYVGENGNWYIGTNDTGKPSRGDKGDKGDTGATPNLSIGTVTTLEAGQNATASMGGTAESPVLNLGIPKGAKGEPGQGGSSTDSEVPTPSPSDVGKVLGVVQTGEFQAGYDLVHPITLPDVIGLGISGATVGQTIKVKNVDLAGSPSSWEAVDMPSGGSSVDIVTSVSASSTDEQVPSAKCLYDLLGNVTAQIDAM